MQRILIILPILLCFSACSNSNNPQGRVAVRGEISLQGVPIENGSIQFESLHGVEPVTLTGGMIRQGTFSVPAKQGLLPGQEYTVCIHAMEEIPGANVVNDAGEVNPKYRDLIPSQYGKASELTFTATKKSPNVFTVDMKP